MNQEISISDLKRVMITKPNIIDIRENYFYQVGRIPTAINVPMNFILTVPQNYLNKQDTYYIYCEMGSRSKRVCQELRNLGYHVVNIIGGYQSYLENN